jgi:exopolyphosphatase/pppGpp-phosphohydrolase
MPIGPLTLLDSELECLDPPLPANLTNALGTIDDHLDDVIVAAPSVLAATTAVLSGRHAAAMAMVELGHDQVPANYQMQRADADEVFRTLVVEPAAERRFNPGLAEEFVESIIASLCIVLSIMRRLGLDAIGVTTEPGQSSKVNESE